jgi:hypothetical protein
MAPKRKGPAPAAADAPSKKAKVGGADGKADGKPRNAKPIVHCIAIDTSICERGFSLMNLLKTARRNKMGTKLLRMLMVI